MTRVGVVILLGAAFAAVGLGRWSVQGSAAPEAEPIDVSVSQIGRDYRLIGRTGVPLGEVCSFEAVVTKAPPEAFGKEPNTLVLRIQKINGKPAREEVWYLPGQLHAPDWFQFDDDQKRLQHLKEAPREGQLLSFRGREEGVYSPSIAEMIVEVSAPDVPVPSDGEAYRGPWHSQLCVYKLEVK